MWNSTDYAVANGTTGQRQLFGLYGQQFRSNSLLLTKIMPLLPNFVVRKVQTINFLPLFNKHLALKRAQRGTKFCSFAQKVSASAKMYFVP